MGIAITLKNFLDSKGVHYDVLHHPLSTHSSETAEAAHVPGGSLAKSVLMEDDNQEYLLAVLPTTHYVHINKLSNQLNRQLYLASEQEAAGLFADCEVGAIPALGEAYGLDTIVDDNLNNCKDIYIEAGDHENLIHLTRADFHRLMRHAKHGSFTVPA
jgi:Ala-tRNA(Pro) deacylase